MTISVAEIAREPFRENQNKQIAGLVILLVGMAAMGGLALLLEVALSARKPAPWAEVGIWALVSLLSAQWAPDLAVLLGVTLWTVLAARAAARVRKLLLVLIVWGTGAISIASIGLRVLT